MTLANYTKFNQYKILIQTLPSITKETILKNEFLLEMDYKNNLEIYYAPFEYVNEHATVVIVGITPGLHQMKMSYSTVLEANPTDSDEEILRQVKNNSSFEGTMRKNLITMLDELGLHEYLGLSSTIELFGKSSHLVHTTSIIEYPVFYKGKNFNGSRPSILKTELLKKYVTDCFATEMRKLNYPLIIPLGVNVSNALLYLAEMGHLDSNNLLIGFPHPSGGNGHRHKQFEQNKESMKQMLHSYFKT